MKKDKRYNIAAYLGKPFNRDTVKVEADFDGNITIVEWNESKAKPTQSQLDALDSEATKLENNDKVILQRQAEYGSIKTQLEFIVEKGIDAFITRQNAVKLKYPKE
tara:strand:+ start:648 stop:965 length:318 start_codon:yes stop_codon:yes gene_type:complete